MALLNYLTGILPPLLLKPKSNILTDTHTLTNPERRLRDLRRLRQRSNIMLPLAPRHRPPARVGAHVRAARHRRRLLPTGWPVAADVPDPLHLYLEGRAHPGRAALLHRPAGEERADGEEGRGAEEERREATAEPAAGRGFQGGGAGDRQGRKGMSWFCSLDMDVDNGLSVRALGYRLVPR